MITVLKEFGRTVRVGREGRLYVAEETWDDYVYGDQMTELAWDHETDSIEDLIDAVKQNTGVVLRAGTITALESGDDE